MTPLFWIELFGLRLPDTVPVSLALTVVLGLLAAIAGRRLRTSGLSLWQTAIEMFVGWVRRTVGDIVGEDPSPYVPLIAGLVTFIALSNLLGVVPVVRPPTADLSTTVALALVVMAAVPYFGIRRHGLLGYLRNYARPHPLLLPFNLVGELTRTLALAVRLFGNVMSGQMVGAMALLVAGVLVPVPLMLLSLLTGLVQAYIFAILATVFIAAAIEVDQHHAEGKP